MEYYVGLDVSLRQTSICVVSEMGSVVREKIVASDPETIAAFVRSRAPESSSGWLGDWPDGYLVMDRA